MYTGFFMTINIFFFYNFCYLDPVYSVDDFTNYASLVADHLVSYHNAG